MSSALTLFAPHAVWIGSAHPFDLHEAYLDFRAPPFVLDELPAQAEIFITADSRYRLWVNGTFVSRGPARSHPWRQSVDRIDVAPFLSRGRNTVAVQVYQPGYSHFAYIHRGAAGVLARLAEDGRTLLETGADWRVRRNASFASNVPRVSIYGSGVEDRNLAQEDDWTRPEYDDAAWSPARIVATVGHYPWTELKLRAVPLLMERPLPKTLLETRLGPSPAVDDGDGHRQLRNGWHAGRPLRLEADADGWFQLPLVSGDAVCWLFDLGRAYACQGWAEVEGAGGGEQLLISYAEKRRGAELVISDPATYCRVRLTERFVLRGGDQVAEPFAIRGGRYLLFMLTGPAPAGIRIRFHVRTVEYPLLRTKHFASGDDELDAIARLCEETLAACLQDGFVDSAWRESSQWVGDALPQALIMASMSEDARPLRQVLVMAAEGAYPDGILPSVLPGEVHAYAIVDYNFMWIELLALYRKLTGDEGLPAELWPALVKLLDRFDADVQHDGLIRSQPGRRLFLDWAPVSRQEPGCIYNLHYLLGLQTAIHLAEAGGRDADAVRWQSRATALLAAVRATFRHDGRWWDDPACTTCSQLASALACLTGAAEPHTQAPLLDAIAARSLDPDDSHTAGKMVLASPFMHHYLFEALRRGGRERAVVEIIRLRWGRWAAAGYPTAWENWNVDFPDGSQCHAFSAHPRYHLAEIARLT